MFRSKGVDINKKNFPIYKDGYVIFKPDPTDHNRHHMVFCNKKHKEQCEFYQVGYDVKSDGSYSLPVFVTQLNQSLFERIDGIVYYSYKTGANGWLLLFNINGRPKYCFTSKKEEEELSEEVSVCPQNTKTNSYFQCKSEKNMKSLFTECFQKSPPIPYLTTDPTPQTESESFLEKHLIILSISVTIIVLILIVFTTALIYRRRQKKVSTLTSSSQYSTSFGQPSGKSIAQSIENAKQRKKDKQNKN